MTLPQDVRYHPIEEPIPKGWRLATDDLGHHRLYSVLIERITWWGLFLDFWARARGLKK